MINTIKLTLIFVLSISILTCSMSQQYKDISSTPSYNHLIGKNFQNTKNLYLHGVALDVNHPTDLSRYAVTRARLNGPEIFFLETLQPGASIKVNKVLKCSNCPFGAPIFIIISIDIPDLKEHLPIFLYLLRVEDQDGKVTLDPDYFTQIE